MSFHNAFVGPALIVKGFIKLCVKHIFEQPKAMDESEVIIFVIIFVQIQNFDLSEIRLVSDTTFSYSIRSRILAICSSFFPTKSPQLLS